MKMQDITISITDNLIELYALVAEVEGMKAENTYREMQGKTIVYGEESFFIIADRIRELKDDRSSEE